MWNEGDFNYDGTVNAEDFTLFSANLGQSATLASTGDVTNGAILNAVDSNGVNLSNVPAPASMGLLTLGAAGMLARRRRVIGK